MKKSTIFLGLVAALIVVIVPFFIKVKIQCRSQYGDCPTVILDKLKHFENSSLYLVGGRVRELLRTSYLVSDFSLQYKLPNIYFVYLLVKKPAFALKSQVNGKIALVDREGRIISFTENSDLPTVISNIGDFPVEGQKVSQTDLFALNLLNGVYQIYQVNAAAIQDGSLLVELPGQERVIFPLEGDVQVLLGSLRLIYSKIQEDGNANGFREIDLRFKNPVLR